MGLHLLNLEVKGENMPDVFKRQAMLKKIQDSTTTEELEKLEKMITPKGKKSLKKHWNTIKRFF